MVAQGPARSEEHTSELQSLRHLVCRLLLEKKTTTRTPPHLVDVGCRRACPSPAGAGRGPASATIHLRRSRPTTHRRCFHFFFFNDTATTEIYTLSLHDALPI